VYVRYLARLRHAATGDPDAAEDRPLERPSSKLRRNIGCLRFPKGGGLMSYGVDPVDLFAKSAAYVDRILRGAKPAELPVQAPTQFQLVIRNTATSLGLAIPQTLLAEADEVVE
jgi:hypothetical protein